jgi:hypothetical protein
MTFRKLIVWFIMSLIFSTQTGISCGTNSEIRMLGLPAPRSLWECTDSHTWTQRQQLQNTSGLQTLGDLIDAHNGDALMAKNLDAWNAKNDQLGSLLNAAVSMLK